MSTYLNNSRELRGCAVSDGAAVQVKRYVVAADVGTGKPVFDLAGIGNYDDGRQYVGVEAWWLEAGFTNIARYATEEAAKDAYNAAVEAIRNGVAAFDLPTEGML